VVGILFFFLSSCLFQIFYNILVILLTLEKINHFLKQVGLDLGSNERDCVKL
jgi:hypothetical protein